jgi:5'-methylthioadenosine phosphorylase
MSEELVGIIGGTGLGDALAENLAEAESCSVETPFGAPSGEILIGRLGERKIAFLARHGKGHKLSPSEVPFAANIFAMKKIGVRALISSGAVGSLKEQIAPGHLAIVDQFIDKTFRRRSTFFEDYAAAHCEMAHPVCDRLREKLIQAAKQTDLTVHENATYVCMEGPQFSTRAESLMHRAWGGDLIGMTAMPEAKLAREAQICYTLVALPSDYDCWREHEEGHDKQTLLKEIIGNLQMATESCLKLIRTVLQSNDELINSDCHCRSSLDLAVWTQPDEIDPERREGLGPLFE